MEAKCRRMGRDGISADCHGAEGAPNHPLFEASSSQGTALEPVDSGAERWALAAGHESSVAACRDHGIRMSEPTRDLGQGHTGCQQHRLAWV